jgi:hypothetical protein
MGRGRSSDENGTSRARHGLVQLNPRVWAIAPSCTALANGEHLAAAKRRGMAALKHSIAPSIRAGPRGGFIPTFGPCLDERTIGN